MSWARRLPVLLVSAALLAGFLAVPSSSIAQADEITYAEMADIVLVETPDMSVAIYKTFPAAMLRAAGQEDGPGYGFVLSAALGYNATEDGMLVLEDVPYHASFEHSTWTVSPVQEGTDPESGQTVTVELTSSVNINKRVAFNSSNRLPGEPGIDIIEGWADVTVRFIVSFGNYSSHYADVDDSPDYQVNGSTELKFDIDIDINEAIDASDLALDIGLMMMDNYTFSPTSMPEQYIFQGYQEDEVTDSYPSENETDGDVMLLHQFRPRDGFKQLFTFVEDEAESFFGWARQAELGWTDLPDELIDVATLYRTDGESLRVYLSTPLNATTSSILHDPSLGLLLPGGNGGYVDIPDSEITIGASGESVMVGLLTGFLIVGTIGAYAVVRKRSSEDPTDLVRLEKNRYYRKKD